MQTFTCLFTIGIFIVIAAYFLQILYCAIIVIFTAHDKFYSTSHDLNLDFLIQMHTALFNKLDFILFFVIIFFIAVFWGEGGGFMLRKQVFEVEFFYECMTV